MKKVLMIILLLESFQYAAAQDYAGPDTTVCSGSPVMIGIPPTNPSYCYYWDAAEGMPESERYIAQPTVSPKHNTVYRVTVRGPQFKQIATDQVQVFVDFGPIIKNPSYINIGMTDTIQSEVELLKDGGRPFLWLPVDQDNTGCFINSFTGEVSQCTTSGTFKFKAQAINDLNCDVEDELEINLGVKELIAIDAKNPKRRALATKGETLIVVNGIDNGTGYESRTINVKAIPNEGGIFGPGTPDWQGNLEGNPTIGDLYVGEMDYPGNNFVKAADDRTVYTNYEDAAVSTTSVEFDPSFLTNTLNYISGFGLIDASCPAQGGFIGYSLPGGTILLTETTKKVEKYADPGIDNAYLYSYSGGAASVCGEVAVPLLLYSLPNFGIKLEFFIAVTGSLGLVVAAYNDPSKESPYGGNVTLQGAIDITAGFKVPISVGVAGVVGAAFLGSGAKAVTSLNFPEINSIVEVGGLAGTLKGTVWVGVPSNSLSVSMQKTFFPSANLGPYTLFTLQN